MSTIEIGEIKVKRSEMKLGELVFGYLPDAGKVSLPIIIANGNEPGPTLFLSSAIHGTEITGIEIIRRLLRETINPDKLRGSIIAAPILNPFAYNNASMRTPHDGANLNRAFPGDPEGTLSYRLAHFITTNLVANADYIIDFHANPSPAMQFTIVKEGKNKEVWEKSRKMAAAFGITTVEMLSQYEPHLNGTITESAGDEGKPGIIIELLYWNRIDEISVQTGLRGTCNVMKHLGMITGEIELQQGIKVIEGRMTRTTLTVAKGGLIDYIKGIGEPINENEVIALIRDPWGDIVEEVKSPENGWILAWPSIENQTSMTGKLVAMILMPKT